MDQPWGGAGMSANGFCPKVDGRSAALVGTRAGGAGETLAAWAAYHGNSKVCN